MLIDAYLPNFDVRDYHATHVALDPAVAFTATRALDLERSWVVRLLFAIRNLPSRAQKPPLARTKVSRSFLDSALDLGWVILGEVPGQELVGGAVTRPWAATITFRGLPSAEFVEFAEPGFTKIAWNIAARKCDGGGAVVSPETRVLATDPESRRRFRVYWFVFRPGIRIIRRVALGQVRQELRQIRQGQAT